MFYPSHYATGSNPLLLLTLLSSHPFIAFSPAALLVPGHPGDDGCRRALPHSALRRPAVLPLPCLARSYLPLSQPAFPPCLVTLPPARRGHSGARHARAPDPVPRAQHASARTLSAPMRIGSRPRSSPRAACDSHSNPRHTHHTLCTRTAAPARRHRAPETGNTAGCERPVC
jgi:hypothetical protein